MMRYYKTQTITIKAGEQASTPIGISPMTAAHAIYGPKTGDSYASVQCLSHDHNVWGQIDGLTVRAGECCLLPALACQSLRLFADMVETEDRVYCYAYLEQAN